MMLGYLLKTTSRAYAFEMMRASTQRIALAETSRLGRRQRELRPSCRSFVTSFVRTWIMAILSLALPRGKPQSSRSIQLWSASDTRGCSPSTWPARVSSTSSARCQKPKFLAPLRISCRTTIASQASVSRMCRRALSQRTSWNVASSSALSTPPSTSRRPSSVRRLTEECRVRIPFARPHGAGGASVGPSLSLESSATSAITAMSASLQ
mmetsp:Transcript_66863/g.175306  ORF Transcript_66863/g.175306 Transcript_66863/m.175306 type:complete len:209 (+) Transcript_66863:1954-2580(+)